MMTIAAYVLLAMTLGPLVLLGVWLMIVRTPTSTHTCFGRRVVVRRCGRRQPLEYQDWGDN